VITLRARSMAEKPPHIDEKSEEAATLQVDEVETLRKELEKERDRANDYLNRLKYLQADFENYKKRVTKEMNETVKYGNRQLISTLLTVVDELECAVEARKESTDKILLKGVEMTLNKLYNILQKEGLVEIETVGKPFDPNKHEAALRVQIDDEKSDGMIVEEIRKGFMLKDMVLRPSLVTVAVNTKKGDME
jgi:molecular chaperone GrpE